jgi:cytochrome oxidase Cu insertion factor (SCO1/SenC/PrrC family)
MPRAQLCRQGLCLLASWILLSGFQGAGRADGLPPLHVKVGDKAPNFTLTSSAGKPVSVSDFPGRHILIDFYRGYW